MDLLLRMKQDRIQAMKDKNTTAKHYLTVFLGDIESDVKRGIDITDNYVIQKIKKTMETAKNNLDLTQQLRFRDEYVFFEAYLPKQLDPDELEAIILDLVQQNPDIGFVMSELKRQYAGLYNGKLASQLAQKTIARTKTT